MPKRTDAELAQDIRDSILRVETYVAGLDFDAFFADDMARDAVVRNLEIIGEASKNLSSSFKDKCAGIEWSEAAGLRDRLIHHYASVNWEIVWHVVTIELPKLKTALKPSPKSGGK
jgi:uncharacterized protein with HEPN domain